MTAPATSPAAGVSRPATLISFIGRGRRDQGAQTYARVEYQIADRRHTSPFFVDAVLRSPWGQPIREVCLVGTVTSSWAALVEEFAASDAELYTALEMATEPGPTGPASGVEPALLSRLSDVLSRRWSMPVNCIAVTDRIHDETAAEIAERFVELFLTVDTRHELLLDVTHAFRSLPIVALSALHMADAALPGLYGRTRVLYGELAGPTARGQQFPELQTINAVSAEIRQFLETFNGERLAERVARHSDRLAKAIVSLSLVVETNALHTFGAVIRQLRNAVAERGAHEPAWLHLVRGRLEYFVSEIPAEEGAAQLMALAEWRAAHGQTGLAILTLWEAFCESAATSPNVTFETLAAEVQRTRRRGLDKRQRAAIDYLHRIRNQVAHGSSLATDTSSFSAISLRKGFTEALAVVRELIESR